MQKYFEICKIHWKEIFGLSLIMHFVFDWFIFGAGVIIGMYIG